MRSNGFFALLCGYAKENKIRDIELFLALDCIPDYMKFIVDDVSHGENPQLFADSFEPEEGVYWDVIDAYVKKKSFSTKELWLENLKTELDIIEKNALLPDDIFPCFKKAYSAMETELSLEDIEKKRKFLLGSAYGKEKRSAEALFRDISVHAARTKPSAELVKQLTCIPELIKSILLSENGICAADYENGKREVSYDTLRYDIADAFTESHDFNTKQEWDTALADEIEKIREAELFPKEVFFCFLDAQRDFYCALSPETIREIKKIRREISKK